MHGFARKALLSVAPLLIWACSLANDSCHLTISLLTCSPGKELYSTFGHSALRVVDRRAGTDIVYNYGTFDFADPQFYSKFVKGKLLYYLNQEDIRDFLFTYQQDNRIVSEQILQLSCTESDALQTRLFHNMEENNRYYRYDFLFDNCTTRLRDLVFHQPGKAYTTASILPLQGLSFREAIHQYLDRNQMPWSKWGIDLLLGSRLDRKMSNEEAMFLPDQLDRAFDSSQSEQLQLVKEKMQIVFETPQSDESQSAGFPPWQAFTLFAAASLIAAAFKGRIPGFLSRTCDAILFFVCGALGILLVFMWVGTEHLVCRDNFNLLWAFPLHLPAAFFLASRKPWTRAYFWFSFLLAALLLIGWFFWPQRMNPGQIPLILLLALRSLALARPDGFQRKKSL